MTIHLLTGCSDPDCLKMAGELKAQLDPAYSRGAAVMPIDGDFSEWQTAHRTARKRAALSERDGYQFAEIDRQAHADEIHAVNTSKAERQGRPMSQSYLDQPVYGPNPVLCERHHVYTYGVLTDDRLVAYLWLYRSGELALVSSILGHSEHLARGVMYLLYSGMLRDQWRHGGTVFYNLWSSGTTGLRWWKERVGLTEQNLGWAL